MSVCQSAPEMVSMIALVEHDSGTWRVSLNMSTIFVADIVRLSRVVFTSSLHSHSQPCSGGSLHSFTVLTLVSFFSNNNILSNMLSYYLLAALPFQALAQVTGTASGFATGVTGGGSATPASPSDTAE